MRHNRYQVFCIFLVSLLLASMFLACGERSRTTTSDTQRRELPRQGVDLLIRAQQAFRQHNYPAALALTDSVARFNPQLADLHFLRGRIFTETNQLRAAREAYEKVVAVDPDYQGAWMNLGNVLLDQGKPAEALEKYQREERLAPAANVYVQIGRAYAKLKKFTQADQAYRRAIQLDSTQATAYMWLGQLYEAEGHWEQAVRFSEQGLRLAPENPNYLYLAATQLIKVERYARAIRYLEEVLRQEPWHAGAHYNLGQAYMRTGRTRLGERNLAVADSLQRIDRRIEDLRIFTEMHPEALENWTTLGDTLRQYGRFDEALRAYESALLLEPYNLSLQTNTATLLFHLGETETAINRYLVILQQNPTYTDVWLNLGVAYAMTGKNEEARWAWQNLLKYEPNHQLAKQYLARLK